MKKFQIAVILTIAAMLATIALTSCSDAGATSDKTKVRAKLKCVNFYASGASYGELTIRYVDTLYNVGDTVTFNYTDFQIIEKASN